MNNYSQPSVMGNNRFSQVPKADIPRSKLNMSHGLKTTMNAGDLVPIYCQEVLPGDTFNMNATLFGRLSTPLHPIMDNLFIDTQFFFVPYRLVWDNWEKFCGQQTDPNDSTDYLIPTFSPDITVSADYPLTDFGQILDYFGIPIGQGDIKAGTINTLPFRAYNLIYNEWYRDQNLQDSLDVPTGDSGDNGNSYKIRKRGKRHDYFTSSLPFPQKGESVLLPLGQSAPVVMPDTSVPQVLRYTGTGNPTGLINANAFNVTAGSALAGSSVEATLDPNGSWEADLTNATAATINQIRQAFQVQRMLERDARGGTRYVELLLSHFGVQSPDFRLQRPEYLGGNSKQMNISSVAATATATDIPQGNLAGVGSVISQKNGFNKSFVEHGVIIGLASVRADLNYQQGVDRMWSRQTRYDFYWPALAHLGEQAVLNKEIYHTGTSTDDEVFGYQERYAEYRYKPSMITGQMRSNHPQSLDTWHLAQDFSALPTLGADFIEENPPLDRVVAVPSEPDLILDVFFDLKAARPMPVYSVPGLVDHF